MSLVLVDSSTLTALKAESDIIVSDLSTITADSGKTVSDLQTLITSLQSQQGTADQATAAVIASTLTELQGIHASATSVDTALKNADVTSAPPAPVTSAP